MAKRILIVDDEANTRMMLEARLRGSGYEVLQAEDGQQALTTARAERPDLVLLDIMLPKLDGYKVCRMLKFDEQYKHIPVILFSAKSQESDVALGMQQGADDYLTKPFESETLLKKIRDLLAQCPTA